MDNTLKNKTKLNGICPYFTMFPLDFPYAILSEFASNNDWVLDPFCGRGTTNYASRFLGLPSIGIDSSPVAVAISQAKLANTSPHAILKSAKHIIDDAEPKEIPEGEFWDWAFHKDVLFVLCQLREALLKDCRSNSRKALRAIILGALHGPRPKSKPSYFSNQSPRTYAPKPGYAVNFWKKRNLSPESVDVLEIIATRADRYFSEENTKAIGNIIHNDSRSEKAFDGIENEVKWVITSPPYYGMRTYIPDQWLRMWFLGGKASVDYSTDKQIEHPNPDEFASQLNQVWSNVGNVCTHDAQLVIRFGGINDRKADPLQILRQSLENSGWAINKIKSAGFASSGRRQALHIKSSIKEAREEYDVWAIRG